MELIELVDLDNKEYQVKYFGTDDNFNITNIDFMPIEKLKFRKPNPQNENKSFTTVFNGNFIGEDKDSTEVIIIQNTDEGAHYMVKVDDFDNIFTKV